MFSIKKIKLVFFIEVDDFFLEFKVFIEVDFMDYFIGSEFFSCVGFEDIFFKYEVGLVGNGEGFLYVVVGDENVDVFGFQFGYDVLNVFYGNGVNIGKRFIQQDKFRIGSEGMGYFGMVVFIVRKGVFLVFVDFFQAKFIDQVFQVFFLFGFGVGYYFQYGGDIVFYIKFVENGRFLWEVVDVLLCLFVYGQVCDVVFFQEYLFDIRFDEVDYYVKCGCFFGIIWLQQFDDFFLINFEGNVFDYFLFIVNFFQFVVFELYVYG